MLGQHNKIVRLKTFNLKLNLSVISKKSPKLHYVICSEMKTASITNKRQLKKRTVVAKLHVFFENCYFLL